MSPTEVAPLLVDGFFIREAHRFFLESDPEGAFPFSGHLPGAHRIQRLREGDYFECGLSVGVHLNLHQISLMEATQVAVNGFVHEKCALAIDDVATEIFFKAAETMRMLNDDGVRAHFDHEAACVLGARGRNMKLSRAVNEDEQIIEGAAMRPDVSHEIDDIEGICAGRGIGRDRKLAFGDRDDSDFEAADLTNE